MPLGEWLRRHGVPWLLVAVLMFLLLRLMALTAVLYSLDPTYDGFFDAINAHMLGEQGAVDPTRQSSPSSTKADASPGGPDWSGLPSAQILCRKCGGSIGTTATVPRPEDEIAVAKSSGLPLNDQLLLDRKEEVLHGGRNATMFHFKQPGPGIQRLVKVFRLHESDEIRLHKIGTAVAHHSWFPGFSWRPVLCPHCMAQLGWHFVWTATGGRIAPGMDERVGASFFAIDAAVVKMRDTKPLNPGGARPGVTSAERVHSGASAGDVAQAIHRYQEPDSGSVLELFSAGLTSFISALTPNTEILLSMPGMNHVLAGGRMLRTVAAVLLSFPCPHGGANFFNIFFYLVGFPLVILAGAAMLNVVSWNFVASKRARFLSWKSLKQGKEHERERESVHKPNANRGEGDRAGDSSESESTRNKIIRQLEELGREGEWTPAF